MQKLLASLITDEEFEKIQLMLNEPNIFSALSVNRMEIRHSNFIGYLLDPNETHGLKDLILKKVLRGIFNSSKSSQRNIFDADYLDYSNVEIRREWRNIDILIILSKDVVVIENKIDTSDHSEQLARYKKTVEESFNQEKYNIHYVYLTPFGDDPNDKSVRNDYINYSYEEISKIIESIITIYRNSLSEKIYFYLYDYLTVLRRELLMTDALNEDARKVYIKHQQAINFIFKNRPNPIDEIVYPAFENSLTDSGYFIGSKSQRIIRFTTTELNGLLPKVGDGWKYKEIFMFELKFGNSEVMFSATISPGDEKVRDAINEAIKESKHNTKTSDKKYLLFAKDKHEFCQIDAIWEQSDSDIKNKVQEIVKKIGPTVSEISVLISKNFSKNKISNVTN